MGMVVCGLRPGMRKQTQGLNRSRHANGERGIAGAGWGANNDRRGATKLAEGWLVNPESAEDFILEAELSLNEDEPVRAAAEALIAVAKILLAYTQPDEMPAGPIDYERHNRVDRC